MKRVRIFSVSWVEYLWEKRRDLILWLIWTGTQAIVFALYRIDFEPLIYASMLGIVAGGLFFVRGFARWRKRQQELQLLSRMLDEKVLPLPAPHDLSEKNYQTLIRRLAEARQADLRENEQKQAAMIDFYTLWGAPDQDPDCRNAAAAPDGWGGCLLTTIRGADTD